MKLTVSAIQMPVTAEKRKNLEYMRRAVRKAANKGARIVLLPEMFCCPYENAAFVSNQEARGGEIWTQLSDAARETGVYLIGGSMPETGEQGRLYNTCFAFDPDGGEIGRHRKAHLFDIDVKGKQSFCESAVFSSGSSVTLVDTAFGKLGLMICFDIRFPELSRLLALEGARLLCVPAAFNMTTGPAHWAVHFRSRAIDNQVFVMGCAPARGTGSYRSYGHSILVTPWGRVVRQLGFEPGMLLEEIDLDEVDRVREQLPLIHARRTDLYELRSL